MSDGMKNDQGKVRWSTLPHDALVEVIHVLEYGAQRYGENNWCLVENARRRYFDAALRHLWAWYGGQDKDEESGRYHLAHAACCVLFLLALTIRGRIPEED